MNERPPRLLIVGAELPAEAIASFLGFDPDDFDSKDIVVIKMGAPPVLPEDLCWSVTGAVGHKPIRCGHHRRDHVESDLTHPCIHCVGCRGFTDAEEAAAEPDRRELG